MSNTKQRLSLQGAARSRRRLLSAALFLAFAALPGAASAIEIKNVSGDGTCPAGWVPLSGREAKENQDAACKALAQWDIARLAGGGSMDGPGYHCQIRDSDERKLGNSLCVRLETLQAGKLKVCLYPNFLPFVGVNNNKEWIGWDVRYLQGFADQWNLTVVPVEEASFDGIWKLPGMGTCDIAGSGISDLPSRRKETGCAGDWTDHYYSVYRAFAVRSADKDKLSKIEDLAGKTVIVTKNSTADSDLVNRLACANIKSVKIERTVDEKASAEDVLAGKAFAYGGGLGSIQYLVQTLGNGLAVAWPHCNMQMVNEQCQPTSEPFSFVVRHASAGLTQALNEYIANQCYPGKSPTDLKCPPAPSSPACSR